MSTSVPLSDVKVVTGAGKGKAASKGKASRKDDTPFEGGTPAKSPAATKEAIRKGALKPEKAKPPARASKSKSVEVSDKLTRKKTDTAGAPLVGKKAEQAKKAATKGKAPAKPAKKATPAKPAKKAAKKAAKKGKAPARKAAFEGGTRTNPTLKGMSRPGTIGEFIKRELLKGTKPERIETLAAKKFPDAVSIQPYIRICRKQLKDNKQLK